MELCSRPSRGKKRERAIIEGIRHDYRAKNRKERQKMNKFLAYSLPDKRRWSHSDPEIQNNRPEDTYFMAELFIGEENGRPVKETFGNLMRSASKSWKGLAELYAALTFSANDASRRGDDGMYGEYVSCMDAVMDELCGKFEDDADSWYAFID